MWITGVTKANTILRDIAKIATTAYKDPYGNPIPGKNWEIVYPSMPAKNYQVTGEKLTPDLAFLTYSTSKKNLVPGSERVYVNGQLVERVTAVTGEVAGTTDYTTYTVVNTPIQPDSVKVYLNGGEVDPNDYTVDLNAGTITFNTAKTDADVVTVDYAWFAYKVDELAGTITFFKAYTENDEITADYEWTNDATNESIMAITDRVVLKTTTTKVDADPDPYGVDPDLAIEQITMYLELYKPAKLVNPETGREDYQSINGSYISTSANNHYINCRVFDAFDPVTGQMAPNARPSEWAKLSWYKDWHEQLKDALDTDPGTQNVQDGVMLQELRTIGINGDLPIQFWASVNNDRIILVLMGDPALDYNNYLISFMYVGKIQSFEGSVNDTAGNFALTTSSSTIPAVVGKRPTGRPERDGLPVIFRDGTLEDNTLYFYRISYTTDGGESACSAPIIAQVFPEDKSGFEDVKTTPPAKNAKVMISFKSLPPEAKEVKLYRAKVAQGLDANKYVKNTEVGETQVNLVDVQADHTIVIEIPQNLQPLLSQGTIDPRDIIVVQAYHKNRPATYYSWRSDKLQSGIDYEFNPDTRELRILRDIGPRNDLNDGWYFTIRFTLRYADPQLTQAGDTFARTASNFKLVRVSNDVLTNAIFDDGSSTGTEIPVLDGRPFPGVRRDPISGAITEIRYCETYGKNTATGVSDIAMYKTRSGLYWQKHQAAFITPEEFMTREIFNPSRWTGKFHLSPVYVVHSSEGYRGMLQDVAVVDANAVVHLDELVVDKGTPNEVTYKFFKITAPFSFLSNSGNAMYGIAVKMV